MSAGAPQHTGTPTEAPPNAAAPIVTAAAPPAAKQEAQKPSMPVVAEPPAKTPTPQAPAPHALRQGPLPDQVLRWLYRKEDLDVVFHNHENPAEEQRARKFACFFIQKMGTSVQLQQSTIAAAIVFWQRYYACRSVIASERLHPGVDRMRMALAALFLGSKVGNEPRHLNDIIMCAAPLYLRRSLVQKQLPKTEGAATASEVLEVAEERRKCEQYNEQAAKTLADERRKVINAEFELLKYLGFDFEYESPYYMLSRCLRMCSADNNVAKDAWSYANDSLITNVALRFPPETIACAAVELAHKRQKKPFANPETNQPWTVHWHVPQCDVKAVEDELENLYKSQPQAPPPQPKEAQPQTQAPQAAATAATPAPAPPTAVETKTAEREQSTQETAERKQSKYRESHHHHHHHSHHRSPSYTRHRSRSRSRDRRRSRSRSHDRHRERSHSRGHHHSHSRGSGHSRSSTETGSEPPSKRQREDTRRNSNQ